jgi:hypothetical protein
MQKMLSNHGAIASKPLGAAGEAVGAAERKWRACSKCLAVRDLASSSFLPPGNNVVFKKKPLASFPEVGSDSCRR